MSDNFIEIRGFDDLSIKIKSLANDKVKRREIEKILVKVSSATVKAAKQLVPVSKKAHVQKRKKQKFGTWISSGTGKKSIGKRIMRRSRNPTVYVSPMSKKTADGWYLRQFVIPGTVNQKSNNFIDRAYQLTRGEVNAAAVNKLEKYIQKQINRLSN